MNCCDEYGNCKQGRDCPVRKGEPVARKVQDKPLVSWIPDAGLGLLIVIASSALVIWGLSWLIKG